MSSTVKPIPDGYQALTPYLIVDGAASAIEFYQKVFGAIELMRWQDLMAKLGMLNSSSTIPASCWPMRLRKWRRGARVRSVAHPLA